MVEIDRPENKSYLFHFDTSRRMNLHIVPVSLNYIPAFNSFYFSDKAAHCSTDQKICLFCFVLRCTIKLYLSIILSLSSSASRHSMPEEGHDEWSSADSIHRLSTTVTMSPIHRFHLNCIVSASIQCFLAHYSISCLSPRFNVNPSWLIIGYCFYLLASI